MEVLTSYQAFKEASNRDLILVLAKTHTCNVCQSTHQLLERNVPLLGQIKSYQIYVDDLDEYRGEAMIFSVPTVIIYEKGKEILRTSRFIDTTKINRLLALYLD
jgi:hypothetical protein